MIRAGIAATLLVGCNPILGIESGELRQDAGVDGGGGGTVTFGPSLEWARVYGDDDAQGGIRVTADAAGNVYCLADFRGKVELSQEDVVASVASWDVMLLKLDPLGKILWRTRLGGDGEDHGAGVAVDPMDGVLMTGSFQGMAGYSGIPLNADVQDQFIVLSGPNGEAKWVQQYGGAAAQAGVTFTADAKGYYVSAQLNGPIAYGGPVYTPVGLADSFIGRLDPTGAYVWSEAVGGPGNEHLSDLAVDPTSAAYAVGAFDPSATMQTFELTTLGLSDGFAFKLSATGAALWALQLGGAGPDAFTTAAADDGGVVVGGFFSSSAELGSERVAGDGQAAFVARIDGGGDVIWQRVFDSSHDDAVTDVAIDARGHVLVTGWTKGDLEVGSERLQNAAIGVDDAFLVELDEDGEIVWGRLLGGTALDIGRGVAWTPDGSALWTGMVVGPIDFGAGQVLEGHGGTDIVIAKLR